jgi:hypothetical protein
MLGAGGGTTVKLQGSTDNFSSSIVDLTGSLTFPTGSAQVLTVASGIDTSTAYRYHRVIFGGNATNTIAVAEVQFFQTTTADNMTVTSIAFTADSSPTTMKGVFRVKEVDAATANTDYTLEFSRDSGTTWSMATLAELYTSPSPDAGIRVCQTNDVDVSAQPSGTGPMWRFKTLNHKSVQLCDVAMYWRT